MLYSCVYRPFPLGSSWWGRTDPLQKINKKYVFETGAKKVRRKVDKMQDVSCQGRGLPHSCCLLVMYYNFSTIWFIIIRHSREGRLLRWCRGISKIHALNFVMNQRKKYKYIHICFDIPM